MTKVTRPRRVPSWVLTRHRPDRRSRIEEVVIPPEHLEEAGGAATTGQPV